MNHKEIREAVEEMVKIVTTEPVVDREYPYREYGSHDYMRTRITEAYTDYLRDRARPHRGILLRDDFEKFAEKVAQAIMPNSLHPQQLGRFLVVYMNTFSVTKFIKPLMERFPGGRPLFFVEDTTTEQRMRQRFIRIPRASALRLETKKIAPTLHKQDQHYDTFARSVHAFAYRLERNENGIGTHIVLFFDEFEDYAWAKLKF